MKVVRLAERVKCGLCGYEWTPRKNPVYRCAKCFSVRWNEAQERREDERLARGDKR
jgi:predicted Zn-ribbon and HTH transcriptional regulator